MIAALVLAAGQSKRMRRPKMVLPWGNTTVIGRVVEVLTEAGISDILVVTGRDQKEVEAALRGRRVQFVNNSGYAQGEMLSSVRVGLAGLAEHVQAALITLGDQPQVEKWVVQGLIETYRSKQVEILVPSYAVHRGHPWILGRALWEAVRQLRPPQTLRDFLNLHSSKISYLPVDTPSVLQDLDTPHDYQTYHPEAG